MEFLCAAQLEAVAKAQKAQTIVDAEAAAIYARLEAEAKGNYEILAKKGEGLRAIVEACGGSQAAFQMLMLEHMDKLSETAAKAISNIKFDKVVVWDGGGKDGQGTATSGFLRGLASAIPPMLQIMKDVGGVEMPEYFGKLMTEAEAAKAAPGKSELGKSELGKAESGKTEPAKAGGPTGAAAAPKDGKA